ncbi:Alpha/Beta hydrolase protein [Boletus reticuloceps]|uniref:Dipeptidyl-peptidase V n=1 Tax=Boletus reticuloceps TaxID=495285 RepID=A0A8I3AC15_9AGAM|nr:Alpha/Beta hydrolase protein [Boletus reticuloceps]
MWLIDAALHLLRLSVQQPFVPPGSPLTAMPEEFALKSTPDILSPQDMLALPRPSAPLPNPAGDLALIPISQYSFDDRKTHKSLAIAPIAVGSDPYDLSLPDGGDAFWLDSRTIAHVVETGRRQGKETTTVRHSSHVRRKCDFRYAYSAGVLVFSAYVHADGDLKAVKDNDEKYDNRGDSALVYDKNFERQWDTWVGPKHKSLFTVPLYKDQGKFVIGDDFTNVLKALIWYSSPVEPFGGTDDFDISDSQIILTAKDPDLPKPTHTKQNIYLVGFDGSNLVELTSGVHGATRAPAFNLQGDKVAWLQLDEDGHESDRAKVVIRDLAKDVSFTITQDWDRSPSSLAFSESGEFIYMIAEDIARAKIFTLPIAPTPNESTAHPRLTSPYNIPVALTDRHAASGLQVLSGGRLLFARSSLTSPNDAHVLSNLHLVEADIKKNASTPATGELTQITKFAVASLQGKQIHPGEDFWFKGAEHDIHGWILTPPGYKTTDVKKWPVLLIIHGGPESCWADSWSTRWNPNVFASQGYVVVAINPTGSTSFGQNLTEGIKEDWGGKPFVDLRNGWKYVLENYPQIDPDRTVACWRELWRLRDQVGCMHVLITKSVLTTVFSPVGFKETPSSDLASRPWCVHDGVFDTTYNGYATEELFFFNHAWGGRPWEEKSFALSRKYSPAYTVSKWSTPQLIIHGSKDYRLPEGDGIAVWHALQQLEVPSRLVIFPDENHWVMNAGNSLKWHYEVFRWFDEFVGAPTRQRN